MGFRRLSLAVHYAMDSSNCPGGGLGQAGLKNQAGSGTGPRRRRSWKRQGPQRVGSWGCLQGRSPFQKPHTGPLAPQAPPASGPARGYPPLHDSLRERLIFAETGPGRVGTQGNRAPLRAGQSPTETWALRVRLRPQRREPGPWPSRLPGCRQHRPQA